MPLRKGSPQAKAAQERLALRDLKKIRWDLVGRKDSLSTYIEKLQYKVDNWSELIEGYNKLIDKIEAPEAYEVTSEQSKKRRTAFQERMAKRHGINL